MMGSLLLTCSNAIHCNRGIGGLGNQWNGGSGDRLLVALGGSWWFLEALGGSWWFLVGFFCFFLWFLVVLGGSWWFFVFLAGFCWFLVVFDSSL